MIRIRPAAERGHFDHGWLKTWHSFSFAGYHDPSNIRFRTLRVLNDDIVAPGAGFGMHPHDNMEIITYPIHGAIAHEDSAGHKSVISAGQVQRMSAGRGIFHSEHNASESEELRLLQIWLFPSVKDIEPGYEEADFPREEKLNRLRLVVSPDGAEGSLGIHQDARIHASVLEAGGSLLYSPEDGRHVWIQMARGDLHLNGRALVEGDGAAISAESRLELESRTGEAEFLLFDLS